MWLGDGGSGSQGRQAACSHPSHSGVRVPVRLPSPASREPLGLWAGGWEEGSTEEGNTSGGLPRGRTRGGWSLATSASLVLRGTPAGGAVLPPRPPPTPFAPTFHGHLEIQPTTAGARSSTLPSCSPTSHTPAHSLGGAWLFWLEVGEGCRERGRISSPYTRHCPPGQPGTESLNNSPNVNNLKIFLFNCFPCPAWGRLCRPARGRGRRPPGSSAASWAVNHGRAPPPPLRSRL